MDAGVTRTLVTGAAGGMGRAIVERLLSGGVSVAAVDVDGDRLAVLRKLIGTHSPTVCIHGDVSTAEGIDATLDAARAGLGGEVDGLVNAAGIFADARLIDLDDATLDRVMEVNARGPMMVTREVARRLVAAGLPGAVVNITSTTAHIASLPGMSAYAASKGALLAFTRAAAADLARHRIRVNAIAPGWIRTPMSGALEDPDAGGGGVLLRRIPMRRAGEPSDIAEGVAWLLGDASSYITGATLPIDGGWMSY